MPKDEKTWLWITADYRDGEIEYLQFIWPFKTSEIAMDFKKTIDDVRKNHQSAASVRRTNPQQLTQMNCSPLEEIEIIYETKVNFEEETAASRLELTGYFYAYIQKKDYPGCREKTEHSVI